MCGAYGFSVKNVKDLNARFAIQSRLFNFSPRYNLRPGQMNPVITHQNTNTIELMLWGLIPSWSHEESVKYKTINAKIEGLDAKASYRKPFRFERCLVPATWFYEWDKTKQPSTPYCIRLKRIPLFAFAGLYDVWTDNQTGKEVRSYTIITSPPNAVVKTIHPRSPVILKRENEKKWLNPDITEPEQIYPLLTDQYPASEYEAFEVSRAVNDPRYDTPDVINPYTSTP